MKKLFAVGIMILIVSHVFALDPVSGFATSEDNPAQTLVTFDLSSTGEGANTYFELCFTTSEEQALGTDTPESKATEVVLDFPSNATSPVATNTQPLYVWWKIVSPETLYVKLGIASPLKNQSEGADDMIGWTASWSDILDESDAMLSNVSVSASGSVSSPVLASDSPQYADDAMGEHTGSLLGSYGSKQVTITTTDTDFTTKSKGTYQAYLFLNCMTE